MFKFICMTVLLAVALAAPQDVRKTGNIQKTSEYHLTAESSTPVPASKLGLTRPAPINPDVHGDPKPKDSIKVATVESHSIHKRDTSINNQDTKTSSPAPASTFQNTESKNNNNQQNPQNPQNPPIKSRIPAHTPIGYNNQPKPTTASVHNHRRSNVPTDKPASATGTVAPTQKPVATGVQTVPAVHTQHKRDTTHTTDDKKPATDDKKSPTDQSTGTKTNNRRNEDSKDYDRGNDNKAPTFVHPVPVTQVLGNTQSRPVRADSQKTPTNYGNSPTTKPSSSNTPTSTLNPAATKPTQRSY